MVDKLLAIVAPHSCCSCGNLGSVLCQVCKNDIVFDAFSACLACLKPTLDDNLCRVCSGQLGITAGWCVGVREGHLKALLDRYKFDSAKEVGAVCAELLNERLPLLPSGITVVPVPTSPTHTRARGFDHMAVIASRLARSRGLPYRQVLRRHSNETQHFKSRAERLKQAAKGLEVVGASPSSILLIDDIYTTGATLQACTKKLQEAGVEQVFVAIIARQTLDAAPDLW